MSMKRTTEESNDDEQTNEDSDSLFPQENNAKRAKLASLRDTTIQDLPIEILECILSTVVAMEVKEMKLAKSVWTEKADLVIDRLGAVCSHWSCVLTTNFFQTKLHRTLDRTAERPIYLEILHQYPIPFRVLRVTTMKDEMFMKCREENIIVYNRNTMAREKDVIAPFGTHLVDIAGCSVSNCVYALGLSLHSGYSILRITKDERNRFIVSPWINDLNNQPFFPSISVSAEGSLIFLSWPKGENPTIASVYDASGYLQQQIMFSPGIIWYRCWFNTIQKSNGNLVLVTLKDEDDIQISEIDANGTIERQSKPSMSILNGVHLADASGRFVITETDNKIKLLDSELNQLDFTGPHDVHWNQLHYDYERNEAVGVFCVGHSSSLLTIFRFTEE